jgi:hypothetical protein
MKILAHNSQAATQPAEMLTLNQDILTFKKDGAQTLMSFGLQSALGNQANFEFPSRIVHIQLPHQPFSTY